MGGDGVDPSQTDWGKEVCSKLKLMGEMSEEVLTYPYNP